MILYPLLFAFGYFSVVLLCCPWCVLVVDRVDQPTQRLFWLHHQFFGRTECVRMFVIQFILESRK